MKKFKKCFVDMDGVLADFDTRFEEIAGVSPVGFEEKHGIDKFWQTVYEDPNFFSSLKPYAYLQDLMGVCHMFSEEPVCILSSPSKVNTPLCMIQKRMWIDRYLGTDFPAIFEKDKHKYAAPNTLLIDDFEKKISKWRAAGGIGYHFNPKTSMDTIEDALKGHLK